MLKWKSRLTSALLSLSMLVTCVPAMADGETEETTESTSSAVLFDVDFDSEDDGAKLSLFDQGGTYKENNTTKGEISNGIFKYGRGNVGCGTVGKYFGTGEDAYQMTNGSLLFKMRFKADKFANGNLFFARGKRMPNGSTTADTAEIEMANVQYRGGYLALNGTSSVTDYALTNGVWYSLEAEIDYTAQKMYVEIYDDNGCFGSYSTGFVNGTAFYYNDLVSVGAIRSADSDGLFCLDYMRLYDKTKMDSVSVAYGEDKTLDGAFGIADGETITVTYPEAITQADAEKITVSGGAELEKTLSDDGKTVTLVISGLSKRTKYVLSVPEVGNTLGTLVSFVSKDFDYYIARAEFDGCDDLSKLTKFDSSGNVSSALGDWNAKVSNGNLKYTRNDAGYGRVGFNFEKPYEVDQTKENIIFELRFKQEQYRSGRELFSLSGIRTSDQITRPLFKVNYYETTRDDGSTAGYLGLRNEYDESQVVTDFKMAADTWYTMKIRADYKAQKGYVEITDDDGNTASGFVAFTTGFKYENITKVFAMSADIADNKNFYIDYFRIYDEDALPHAEITYGEDGKDLDGAVAIADGTEVKIGFEDAVTEADLDKITISGGAELTKTLSEDGKTVTAVISGLSKRTSYTLTVPTIGVNVGGEATFVSADASYYLFRAEFDEYDGDTYTVIDGQYTDNTIYSTTVSDGALTVPQAPDGAKPRLTFKDKIPMSEDSTDIVIEARLKINEKNNNMYTDGTVATNDQGFFEVGPGYNGGAGSFYLGTKDGMLSYGITPQSNPAVVTEYPIYNDTWYTFTLKLNNSTRKISVYAVDDAGRYVQGDETSFRYGYAYDTLDYIGLGYAYWLGQYVDYIRIYDASGFPSAKIALSDGTALDGFKRVKSGDTVKVTFESAVTADELSGNIKIDGTAVSAVLSDDGLTATVTIPEYAERSSHTMVVSEIGKNKSATAVFRIADGGKYLLKLDFDGNDDDSVFYKICQSDYEKFSNSMSAISDGVLTFNPFISGDDTRTYRNLQLVLDKNWLSYTGKPVEQNRLPLDIADATNIKLDMRIKWGEGTIPTNAAINVGPNLACISIDDGYFRYGGNSQGRGTYIEYFTREGEKIPVVRDAWYTISFTIDFASQRYCVNITKDGEADVYSSPWINTNLLNDKTKTTLGEIGFYTLLDNKAAPYTIDYIYLTDENYGKAAATYGDGVELDRSALVPVSGNTFTLSAEGAATNANGITLKEVGGETISITTSVSEGKVEVSVPTLKYDTKYALNIPKSVFASPDDQTITFRTVYDETAALSLPAEFAKDKFTSADPLTVVYFGGSITQMNGWRVTVSDWFNETYGAENVKNISASIGGTGSEYGRIRLNKDVASHDPDIVFVEFTVNDSTSYSANKSMESIVRQLNSLENPPVIIFVYTTARNYENNSTSIVLHDEIAESYNIPVINIRDYVMSRVDTDSAFKDAWKNTNTYISADGTHPTTGEGSGSELFGNYVISLIKANASKYFAHAKSNSAVSAVAGGKDTMYKYLALTDDAMTAIGDSYSFKFVGDEINIEFKRTEGQGGTATVYVDEKEVDVVNTYVSSSVPNSIYSYTGFGAGEHTVKVTVTEQSSSSASAEVDLVGIYTVLADNEYNTPEFSSNTVTSGVKLTATAKYKAHSEEDITLVIALYDEKDALVGVSSAQITTDSTGAEKTIEHYVTPGATAKKAKAFLWNTKEGMEALAPAASIGF